MEPKYPCLKWLYHTPNGGRRNAQEAQKFKAMGVRPGILDLGLDVARQGFHGWRCELKKPGTKPKASAEQVEYMDFLRENGYYVLLSNDFEEVKASLMWYLS